MKLIFKLFLSFLIAMQSLLVFGQKTAELSDSLSISLKDYKLKKNEDILFVHFDKTVYAANENVWFTCYALNAIGRKNKGFVSVMLVNDKDHSIVLSRKFVMNAGIAFGNLVLPDSIDAGKYNFIVYDNEVQSSRALDYFTQPISIKSTAGNNTNAKPVVDALPALHDTNHWSVKFFPEGGSLSEGLLQKVAVEVRDSSHLTSVETVVIYKDQKPVDTVVTDKFGMGTFKLISDAKAHYHAELPFIKDNQHSFQLPEVINNRPVLTVNTALNEDTLKINLKNRLPAKLFVVIHNYGQLFFYFPVEVTSLGKTFKIALSDLPKGISEVTILDSLQRLCCERLFFAHFRQRNNLVITTDQEVYKPRQKVLVNLNLSDQGGNPIAGVVSIACVQANRLGLANKTNIERYVYLDHELGQLPVKDSYMGSDEDNRSYLENILLIKGWRNYSWKELSKVKTDSGLSRVDSLKFSGVVTQYGKPLKKSISLVLMKDSSLKVMETDNKGQFLIDKNELFMPAGHQLHIIASGSNPEKYTIKLNDPYQLINLSIAAGYNAAEPVYQKGISLREQDLPVLNHAISLKEVKIRSARDNSFFGSGPKVNECGDYVCMYGFLDCPVHVNNAQNVIPFKGKTYKKYDGTNADGSDIFHIVIYEGCIIKKYENAASLNGIYFSAEYYPQDYGQYNPTEPQYLSTIYWNHLYRITPGNKAPVSFFTGDITGDFKFVIQGVTDNGVVYAEKDIFVKEP